MAIHKFITNGTPYTILALFNINNQRLGKDISIKSNPRTYKYIKFYINIGTQLYNKIPTKFKLKSKTIFKKLTKKWIQTQSDHISDTND